MRTEITRRVALRIRDCAQRSPFGLWLAVSVVLFLLLFAVLALATGKSQVNPRVVRLAITFPEAPAAPAEPIVVTGRPNAGDFLGVRFLSRGIVQFQYDSWSYGGPFSEPVAIYPGTRYEMEVRMPSFVIARNVFRPARSADTHSFLLRFEGRDVLRQNVHSYPTDLADIYYGSNPIGGTTCSSKFSGTVDVLPAQSSDSSSPDSFLSRLGWTYYRHPYRILLLLAVSCALALLILRKWLAAEYKGSSMLAMLPRLLPALVCGFVCIPLIDLSTSFYIDWINHVWLLAYHGVYWSYHSQFADVIHTVQAVGMPHDIFYGGVFYGLLAIPASFLGPDVTVRLAILAALLVQYHSVWCAMLAALRSQLIAHTAAIAVTCAIYSLTNLYQRSALPEFIATCFLTAALCSLLRLSLTSRSEGIWKIALSMTMSLGIVLIAHPITALLGSSFIALSALTLLVVVHQRLRFLIVAALSAVIAAVPVLPWLYAMGRLYREFDIGLAAKQNGLRLGTVDTLWIRMSPFPFDPRSLLEGIYLKGSTTPYIDLQVNVPLLLWVMLLLAARFARHGPAEPPGPETARSEQAAEQDCRRRIGKALLLFGAIAFVVFLLSSAVPAVASRIPQPFASAQYAYRLITYCNLSILAATFGIALFWRSVPRPPNMFSVPAAIILTLSLSTAVIKLPRVESIMNHESVWDSESQLLSLPTSFYGLHDFTITHGLSEISRLGQPPEVKLAFTPQAGAGFGQLEPVTLSLDGPHAVITNVIAFPWNKVVLDGAVLQPPSLQKSGKFLAFEAPAGRHVVAYKFTPDPVWLGLRRLSGIFRQ